jgi:hypothetical protein
MPQLPERSASRVEALLIVVAIAVLIAILPQRYHILPTWFAWIGIAAMILPILLGAVLTGSGPWQARRARRGVHLRRRGALLQRRQPGHRRV